MPLRTFIAIFLILLASSLVSAQAPPSAKFVVVLDAAHGGDDGGATLAGSSGTEPEKTITLALSVRLRSLLAARGIAVVTTRESDVALDPERRAEIANRAQAQACLTLHASDSGSGVHLFLSSLPPVQPARFLPWNTAQAAWIERSIALAGDLNSALQHADIKVTLGRTALTTIDSMACPAVVVEIAPEASGGDSSTPAAALDDSAYQARIAEALSAGLLEWRQEPRQP